MFSQAPEAVKIYAEFVITDDNRADHDAYCQHANVKYLHPVQPYAGTRYHVGECLDCGLNVWLRRGWTGSMNISAPNDKALPRGGAEGQT